ncbi:MAG: hypothetical protein KDK70_38490 [Myxococcales bacterium]|nr:hypothetical protein [Myxococcales bacterium]
MILTVASLLLALAGPGQLLENPEAQAKLAEAQQAFADEDFDAAAAAVEAAYLIEPEPMLLYPWAQAERSRGNCAAAIELYQRFLDSEPPEQVAGPARENMARCQEQVDAESEEIIEDDESDVVDEVLAEPTEPESTPTQQDDRPKAKAWYKDPVGGVLVGVGVVGVGVGAGLMGAGASAAKGAADQDSHMDYLDQRDRATSLRNGGAVALSIGAVLVLGGIVRYAIVAKKSKEGATAWRVAPTAGRRLVGVTFGRRF